MVLTEYSLKRRFEQNQEDCAFTIAALLPTAGEQILSELPVEQLTVELRKKKAEKRVKKEVIAAEETDTTTDGTKVEGESVAGKTEADDVASLKSFVSEGGGVMSERTVKSRTELWEEIKISCLYPST